jgi:hypothetical protein
MYYFHSETVPTESSIAFHGTTLPSIIGKSPFCKEKYNNFCQEEAKLR